MNASASRTGSVSGRSKASMNVAMCRPDEPRALEDRSSAALGVLQDRQQQRQPDAFEDREQDGEGDEPDDLGRSDVDDREHAPNGVDAQVLVEELDDSLQQCVSCSLTRAAVTRDTRASDKT